MDKLLIIYTCHSILTRLYSLSSLSVMARKIKKDSKGKGEKEGNEKEGED
jgi:hypothetical protein